MKAGKKTRLGFGPKNFSCLCFQITFSLKTEGHNLAFSTLFVQKEKIFCCGVLAKCSIINSPFLCDGRDVYDRGAVGVKNDNGHVMWPAWSVRNLSWSGIHLFNCDRPRNTVFVFDKRTCARAADIGGQLLLCCLLFVVAMETSESCDAVFFYKKLQSYD